MGIKRPGVGVGIIIENEKKEILIGKRKSNLSPFYSIPGGHLEAGETFEEAAKKEVFEETGLIIDDPKVFCVTNNLRTFQQQDIHFVSVSLIATKFSGELINKEPEKCEFWRWYPIDKIPNPQFDASEFAINCFKKGKFYIPDQHWMTQQKLTLFIDRAS